jgi:hypothetical protein
MLSLLTSRLPNGFKKILLLAPKAPNRLSEIYSRPEVDFSRIRPSLQRPQPNFALS